MKKLTHQVAMYVPLLLLSVSLAVCVNAQNGGKAEPLRVEFKPGSHSTMLTGKVKNQEEAEYVFSGKKGQKLTVKLTSMPWRSSVFSLKGPEDDDLGLEFDANWDYSGVMPKSGDYLLVVNRPTASPGVSTYRLSITIR